jgi:hypothetical protein
MAEAITLSPEEIEQVTERKKHRAQARVLCHLGIDHKVRPDGSIVVLRTRLEEALGAGRAERVKEPEPNWSAI